MKNRKTTLYAFSVSTVAIILAIHPMVTSTYASLSESLIYFGASIIPMLLLLTLASKYVESQFSIHAISLATILTIGNAAALPLLQYTSAFDHAVEYAKEISMNSAVTVLTLPVTWAIVSALIWILRQSSLIQRISVGMLTGISVVYSLMIFLLTDRSSNTTIIQLGSHKLQAAVPVLILSTIFLCLLLQIKGKLWSGMLIGSIILMNGTLVICGETGIPLIFLAGSVIYYYLLQPHRIKLLNIGIPVLSGVGGIGVFIMHNLHDSLKEGSLLYSLSDKIETRIFAESVDQVNAAIRSLQSGGWFGSAGYNVYLMEGSSDLSVISILHYCGLSFLLVIFAAAIPMFYTGAVHITHHKMRSDHVLNGICLSMFIIMFSYNLLMGIGLAPILGSQMPFTGASETYSVLSGFLLGSICYPRKVVKAIISRMKGDDFQCVTRKEIV